MKIYVGEQSHHECASGNDMESIEQIRLLDRAVAVASWNHNIKVPTDARDSE